MTLHKANLPLLLLALISIGVNCKNHPGQDEPNQFEISFDINRELYLTTDWGEPPQFAIWLEHDKTEEIRTLFVTHRTANDHWKGRSACPESLPYWVTRFKAEYDRDIGPTFTEPLPDAYSGATPKSAFAQRFGVTDGNWICYLEVNVSGDYNPSYDRNYMDEWTQDYGNGQPSIVYACSDITNPKTNKTFEIVGQTGPLFGPGQTLPDTSGITSAHLLLKYMKLSQLR